MRWDEMSNVASVGCDMNGLYTDFGPSAWVEMICCVRWGSMHGVVQGISSFQWEQQNNRKHFYLFSLSQASIGFASCFLISSCSPQVAATANSNTSTESKDTPNYIPFQNLETYSINYNYLVLWEIWQNRNCIMLSADWETTLVVIFPLKKMIWRSCLSSTWRSLSWWVHFYHDVHIYLSNQNNFWAVCGSSGRAFFFFLHGVVCGFWSGTD